jgi:hypothetical protein
MELMQLRCIEKGSESMDLKFKSLTARWYGCKTKKLEKSAFVADSGVYIPGIFSSLCL